MTPAAFGETSSHVGDIRHADITALRAYFSPSYRVLEIGGGNGLQASVVSAWGCAVESIDISCPTGPVFHPVTLYDGVHIPFEDGTFDVVYSSFVLEHVRNQIDLLCEMRRVLKPTGRGLHIVPGTGWRFWTMATHYPHLLKRAAGLLSVRSAGTDGGLETPSKAQLRPAWRRVLVSGAHGEYRSAVAELICYRRAHWRHLFQSVGFDVLEVRGTGLFFTGYRLLPSLRPPIRQRLATWLGSAGQVFIIRPSS